MLKVYLAGPITTALDSYKEAFYDAERIWQAAGWATVNPAMGGHSPGHAAWRHYMIRDIPMLVSCDAIAMLPGYEASPGAMLELTIAKALDIPHYDASHPATYAAHRFVAGYNACCDKPLYNHEEAWPTRAGAPA